jgi:hypothetical protein
VGDGAARPAAVPLLIVGATTLHGLRAVTGLVPASAWDADAEARRRGRVEMFNAGRPDGLDGWTMDVAQYELLREHVLDMVPDAGEVLLKDVVAAGQARFGSHPAFPGGRLRNYVTFVKVDLEARGLVERVPGSSPQRLRRAAGQKPMGRPA